MVIVALALIGFLFWSPVLWVGIALGPYLLYRIGKRGYAKIHRIKRRR
ncbi:MAG: hypothetical protein DDT24_00269 [Chloroflexi bacterium]|nr:hypothetical protein [Chloroflexota bacterium]